MERRYIVCVPRKWNYTQPERHVAYPYSVKAENPLRAARAVFADPANTFLHTDAYGEVVVKEANGGRLDDYCHFYTVEQITGKKGG